MDMSSLINSYSPYELYHHGILGMKWGVRRYQNKDGTLTELGRKKYLKDAERGKATEEDKQRYEKTKEKALKLGKASDIVKFRNELTKQDIDLALQRLETDRRLAEALSYEKTGFDRIDSAMKKVGKITNWADTGVKAYEQYQKIQKILNGQPTNDQKQKDKDKNKQENQKAVQEMIVTLRTEAQRQAAEEAKKKKK